MILHILLAANIVCTLITSIVVYRIISTIKQIDKQLSEMKEDK